MNRSARVRDGHDDAWIASTSSPPAGLERQTGVYEDCFDELAEKFVIGDPEECIETLQIYEDWASAPSSSSTGCNSSANSSIPRSGVSSDLERRSFPYFDDYDC